MTGASNGNNRVHSMLPMHETDSLIPKTTASANENSRQIWLRCRMLLVVVALAVVLSSAYFIYTRGKYIKSQEAPHEWWEQLDVQTSTVILPGEVDAITGDAASLRWGIIGLGRIARDFCTALNMVGANVTAVAAGSLPDTLERARAFAKTFSVPQYYGSYEEMAVHPNVDIVYIATTNQLHLNNTLLMLRAGKNVLVEKPMALDTNQARAMATEAIKQKRLLMTNYWTRFFPVTKYTRRVLSSKQLGSITAMHGDFGFPAPPDPMDRFLNRSLGGGAMLDLGCYLVNLAVMASDGSYPIIEATGQTSYLGVDYNVDTEVSFGLKWAPKVPARDSEAQNKSDFSMIMSGQASFRRPSSFEVEIAGSHGRIVIHGPANAPDAATLYDYEPYGPLKYIKMVQSKMPEFDTSYGPQQYPHGAGFTYVIDAIETCMREKGIPGGAPNKGGCLELEELTMKEQLTTVEITEEVMRKTGYWKR